MIESNKLFSATWSVFVHFHTTSVFRRAFLKQVHVLFPKMGSDFGELSERDEGHRGQSCGGSSE